MNNASNGNSQQFIQSIFMTGCGSNPLQHAKAWVWYLWKTALFLAIKNLYYSQHARVGPRGVDLRSTVFARVGSNPTVGNFFNIKNYTLIKFSIKLLF